MDGSTMTETAVAAGPSALYLWLKFFHVLGVLIYAGGFLTLTRMVGKAVRFENPSSRIEAYAAFRRMHKFVDWGGLAIMLVTGLWILVADPAGKAYMQKGYFHGKLTFILVLLACDVWFTTVFFRMKGDGPQPRVARFMAMHGVVGLAILGALFSVFVLRG